MQTACRTNPAQLNNKTKLAIFGTATRLEALALPIGKLTNLLARQQLQTANRTTLSLLQGYSNSIKPVMKQVDEHQQPRSRSELVRRLEHTRTKLLLAKSKQLKNLTKPTNPCVVASAG
ncbi:MAG: hypothetical protein P3M72_00170 [Candidatus Hodgkinia cicadicola]|nr:MAG: hypothetical protein P3M72_00170 [Candidatus Hodgkinia cicadicola]